MGEQGHPGHVTERPEPVSCLAVLVDPDGAVLVDPGAHGVEPEARSAGTPTGGEEDHVGVDASTPLELDGGLRPGAQDPAHLDAGAHIDPVGFEGGAGELTHPGMLAGDEALGAFEDRDPGAHAAEELAQLDAHRAVADHRHRAGDLGQGGGLAVRPDLGRLEPLDRWADGLRTGSDDDVVGFEDVVADRYPAGAGQAGVALHHDRALLLVAVDLGRVVEMADHVVPVVPQARPVDRRRLDAGDPAGRGTGLGGAQQGLGGDAGPVGALPADQLALYDRHPLAGSQQATGGDLATGTEADHDGVETLAHDPEPCIPSAVAARRPRAHVASLAAATAAPKATWAATPRRSVSGG